MAQPTAKHLAQLARMAHDLGEKRILIEDLQRTLERVTRAGIVTSGQSWMLGQVRNLLDAGLAMLAALEEVETTQEATDQLVKVERLLARAEWDLADDLLRELQVIDSDLTAQVHNYEDEVAQWRERLAECETLLSQAKRVGAPVVREERQLLLLQEGVSRVEQALRDQQFGLVPVLYDQLSGRGSPSPEGGEEEAPEGAPPNPEDLAAAIGKKVEETRGIARSFGLLLLGGPLLNERYEYTVLMRTVSEPGIQHGVNVRGLSPVLKGDRDRMVSLVQEVTDAVNAGLLRQFRQQSRSTVQQVDEPTAPTAVDEEQEDTADLEETARHGRPVESSGGRAASVDAEDLAKSVGDLMYRLLLPVQMQDYLGRTPCSITITTNDLELPWELMWYRDSFLCLTHPVARMPMGGAFPRENRPPVRPDGKSRFLLIYADPEGNLPAAEREIELIREALEQDWANLVHVDVWKGRAADTLALTDALRFGSYDVIHYAGHASFNQDDPDNSGLLLHGREVFPATRIRRLLEGRPLVFLNACESGRVANDGSAQIVREYSQVRAEGLASTLIYSGALGCIGALWPIYDKPAAEFAIEFYNKVLEGHMIGEAMRQARNELKNRHRNQITWAAFVLYGDPTYRLVD